MRAWLLLALLLPVAAAEPVTMYIHLNDQDHAPINTQPPVLEHISHDLVLRYSQTCIDTGAELLTRSHHTWYALATPGPVHYDPEHDDISFHHDWGIGRAFDLPAQDMSLTWLLEVLPTLDMLPGAVPQVTVTAELFARTDTSPDMVHLDGLTPFASGQTAPADLHPLLLGDHPHVATVDVADRAVYQFTVPLVGQATTVPVEGYTLRVEATMDVPGCDGQVAPGELVPFTSVDHHPVFVWEVPEPLLIETFMVMAAEDFVTLHAEVMSPFGTHDAYVPGAAEPGILTVAGPEVTWEHVVYTYGLGAYEDAYKRPAKGTWLAEDPPAGIYEATLTAQTPQGVIREANLTFYVLDDVASTFVCEPGIPCDPPQEETPIPLWPVAAALLLVARRLT